MKSLWLFVIVSVVVLGAPGLSGEADKPKPVNVEKVNSETDEEDPFISSDNLSLFYASNGAGNWDILLSQRSAVAKPFAAGKVFAASTKDFDERSPFFRENKLYFASNRVPEEKKEQKNFDLWHKTGERAALPLLGVSEPEDELHPCVTPAGKEFYFSRQTRDGWLLFVGRGPNPGPIGDAKPVGFPPGFHHVTLSSTTLTMYLQGPLEKERTGLFRAKRAKVGAAWGKPEPIVNLNHPEAPRGDMSPCLTADGLRLYFVSDRPGGKGGLDIWHVATSQLKTAK